MAKLISTPKFLCQSKLLSRVSYGHVSYLMAGADIIESCQHISCLSCRAQLWKLGDWEKGKCIKRFATIHLVQRSREIALQVDLSSQIVANFLAWILQYFANSPSVVGNPQPNCSWCRFMSIGHPDFFLPDGSRPWSSGLIWYGLRLFGSLANVHSAQIWPQNMENSSGITERNQSNWVWTNML